MAGPLAGDQFRADGDDREREARLLNRRVLLRRALALSVSVPAAAVLLAACGDDEDEPTPTSASATATGGQTSEPTATTAEGEATATGGQAEEPSATSEPGATPSETGGENPRLFGLPIEPAEHEGGSFIYGHYSAPDSLNPIVDLYFNPMWMVYETLIEPAPDAEGLVGNLAETWESSDDGLTWTLHLREGVTWQDGEPFVAEDIAVSYGLYMNPDGPSSEVARLTEAISGVEVVDERTVAFTTPRLIVDFVAAYVVELPMLAAHIFGDVPIEEIGQHPSGTGDDLGSIVGTGPFKVKEFVRDDHLTVERHEGYWDGAPHLDEIIVTFPADESVAATLLQAGQIEWYSDIDPLTRPDLEATGFLAFGNDQTGSVRHVSLNLDPEKTTLFQDKRVRQAMLYALDRQAISDAVEPGVAQVAHDTMHPLTTFVNRDEVPQYDYDPDKAVELFAEAGWTTGDDGVLQNEQGERFSFIFAGPPYREQQMVPIQEFWRQVGIEAELDIREDDLLYTPIYETKDFTALHDTWGSGPFQPDQSWWFGCAAYPGGVNIMKYCNEEVDALYQEASSTTDFNARVALYTQIQQIIMDELPILPINVPLDVSAYNARIHNLNPVWPYFYTIETWWVEPE